MVVRRVLRSRLTTLLLFAVGLGSAAYFVVSVFASPPVVLPPVSSVEHWPDTISWGTAETAVSLTMGITSTALGLWSVKLTGSNTSPVVQDVTNEDPTVAVGNVQNLEVTGQQTGAGAEQLAQENIRQVAEEVTRLLADDNVMARETVGDLSGDEWRRGLEQAVQLYDDGEIERVIELCGELLDAAGPHPVLYHLRARALLHQGAFEKAVDQYRSALDLEDQHLDGIDKQYRDQIERLYATLHSEYAYLRFRRGDAEDAEQHYRRAVRLAPSDGTIHNAYGWFLVKTGRFEQAAMAAEHALELTSGSASARHTYARALHEQGDYEEAKRHYERALDKDSSRVLHHRDYAKLLHDVNRYQRAEDAFERALEVDDEDAETHQAYANLLADMGEERAAKRHFDRALELSAS